MIKLFKGKIKIKKSVEDEILERIENRVQEFLNVVKNIEKLNILELKSDKEKLIEEQYEEMKNIISSLIILSDIFIELKNYIEAFINEIDENKFLDPNTKISWIKDLMNELNKVKEKIYRMFMEVEVLTGRLERI